jgi:general secretion pathway protein G
MVKQLSTRTHTRTGGFTLIELLVVMAIIALLLAIAAPRYFSHLDRSKEAALKQTLNVMRDAIDKFHGDHDSYPDTLEELVTRRYLRRLPVDPLTESDNTWVALPPVSEHDRGNVYDVRSGAPGEDINGLPYSEW